MQLWYTERRIFVTQDYKPFPKLCLCLFSPRVHGRALRTSRRGNGSKGAVGLHQEAHDGPTGACNDGTDAGPPPLLTSTDGRPLCPHIAGPTFALALPIPASVHCFSVGPSSLSVFLFTRGVRGKGVLRSSCTLALRLLEDRTRRRLHRPSGAPSSSA